MLSEMVLSIAAQDRPGLVKVLSQVVADHGGNWIDSSLARLGGEFAGILRVAVPAGSVEAFAAALAALAEQNISVSVRRGVGAAPAGPRTRLELTGIDHPGIVHEISSALAAHGVSIDELHTQVFAGSMTGERHFAAKAVVVLPETLSYDALRDELEQIATDIMVEIDLKDDAKAS